MIQRFRDAVIAIVLVLLPFLFLNSNLKDPTHLNALDRTIIKISAPVQYIASELADLVSDFVQNYVWLVDVRSENERLQKENFYLRSERQLWMRDALENKRLREMVRLHNRSDIDLLGAEVIAKDINAFFRVVRLRLDRGKRDLVKSGMPIIVPAGLVGQIQRTAGGYSDALLTVDRRSAVDVVIERNGARGILRGTGQPDRYLTRIQYLDRSNEIKPGDTVITSGLGKRFPPSIPIGRVSKVVQSKSGLHQEAEVVPFVDFSALEEVFIVLSGSKQQSFAQEDSSP